MKTNPFYLPTVTSAELQLTRIMLMDKTNQDHLLVLCRLFTHFLFNREKYNQILKISVDEGREGKYYFVLECSELELHG